MKVVILAAGKGIRLGAADLPKPLTLLENGESILGMQLTHLSSYISLDDIIVVVGYKKEMIIDAFPNLLFVFNPLYYQENTAKSLLRALRKVEDNVLWLNGDVLFHPSILLPFLGLAKTRMLVNETAIDEEAVKYRADAQGKILEVSKTAKEAQGEALGINFILANELSRFRHELERCGDMDYFEKGIEACIRHGMEVQAFPVAADLCTEIDFPEDLVRANVLLNKWESH